MPHSHIQLNQREFNLFQQRFEDPRVQQLVNVCQAHGGWLLAREVVFMMGLANTESNRRNVRAWAEAAGDELISGQRGYRHVDSATPEEIRHFYNWMTSQAQKMAQRAQAIKRRAHALIG